MRVVSSPLSLRCALLLSCGAFGCASSRGARVEASNTPLTPAPVAPPAPPATQPAAPAHEPGDPPNSRRETFRGCSIAVPADARPEAVDMGVRVLLPTDTGETLALAVGTRVWSAGATRDWAEFERGLRSSIADQHGSFLFFTPPVGGNGPAQAAWHQHLRLDRRERGRVLTDGRRFAIVTCSASPTEYAERVRSCDATMESLTLDRPEGPRPTEASREMRWIGERGIFAQAPDGWHREGSTGTIATLVERHADASAAVELNGGDLEVPATEMLANLRRTLEQAGATFSAWAVQRTSVGVKLDYESAATTTLDRFIRQQILAEGWRLCVATCVGPEAFVVAHDSFCGHWLPSLRVAR